jgi:hypothetical protein
MSKKNIIQIDNFGVIDTTSILLMTEPLLSWDKEDYEIRFVFKNIDNICRITFNDIIKAKNVYDTINKEMNIALKDTNPVNKKSRYDWNDPRIPEWTVYITTDYNGQIVCRKEYPSKNIKHGYWYNKVSNNVSKIYTLQSSDINSCEDWEYSLEERPKK